MKRYKNIIALLIIVFMCFLVGCTGDPAPEVEQIVYNTTFHTSQSTQATSLITQTIISSKESKTIKETQSSVKSINKTNKNKSTTKNKVVGVIVNKPKTTGKQSSVVVVESSSSVIVIEIETTTVFQTQTTTLPPLRDDEMCFITENGEKYHRQGCRYLKRSCIEIIVRDAKEKEYTPCKVCKP